MSWLIKISARRVLPTRVVPSTMVCPTRSPNGNQMSDSYGSTPCSSGLPPTGGSGATGFHHTCAEVLRVNHERPGVSVSFCLAQRYSRPGSSSFSFSGSLAIRRRWVWVCVHLKPLPRNKALSDTGICAGVMA